MIMLHKTGLTMVPANSTSLPSATI